MKPFLFTLFITAVAGLWQTGAAQPVISQSVFAAAGHSYSSPDIYLSSTLGESFIFGGNREDEFACQGFQSGLSVLHTSTPYPQDHVDIRLYPNPASRFIIIEWKQSSDHTILLHNTLGELVLLAEVHQQLQVHLDISHLAAGMYSISLIAPTRQPQFAAWFIHQP